MSWLILICHLILLVNCLSEASHENKLSSAVVVGTVYCDTCFQEDFSKTSHFISGAKVAVECKGRTKPSFRKEVKTDNQGEFKVHLPFSVSKHVKKIEECSVKLISSSEPYCAVASSATSSSLHLKSKKQGMHIFSAGFFTFKPLKQPNLCNEKPSIKNSKDINTNINPEKTVGYRPNTSPLVTEKDFSLPPNPFQPPSLIPPNPLLPTPVIPNPLQPSPAPLIPNPLQPIPTPFLPFPPIPGLTPPSSPSPSFPVPIPPIPSLPLPPLNPGIPPVPSLPLPLPLPPLNPGIPLVPSLPLPPLNPGIPPVPSLPLPLPLPLPPLNPGIPPALTSKKISP